MIFFTRLAAICAISLFITCLLNILLVTDSLYFNSLAEKLSYEQIEAVLNTTKQWEWLGYLMIPMICLLKCSLVALCLTLGNFLLTGRSDFKKMLKITISAEYLFLLPVAIKLIWFLFVQTTYTLKDLQYFCSFIRIKYF